VVSLLFVCSRITPIAGLKNIWKKC